MNDCNTDARLTIASYERDLLNCTLSCSDPRFLSICRREKNQRGNNKERTGEEQATKGGTEEEQQLDSKGGTAVGQQLDSREGTAIGT